MVSPSLADLRYFDAALSAGSLSAAARRLGVSQQAVSNRLRNLERVLGLELLHRTFTGVAATAAGAAIHASAQQVLLAADALDAQIAKQRGEVQASIAVSASQTIASHLLPGWLLRLRQDQEASGQAITAVDLRTENSDAVIARVKSGKVDLGFIETPEPPQGLGTALVRHDEMVLAVSAEHPLAAQATVTLEEAARLPLVVRERGSGTRAAFEMALSTKLGIAPVAPAVTLATEAAVRSAVAHGVAPAVLSELTVQDDVRLGRIRALRFAPQPVTRPLTAVWRGTERDLIGARRQLVELAWLTSLRLRGTAKRMAGARPARALGPARDVLASRPGTEG